MIYHNDVVLFLVQLFTTLPLNYMYEPIPNYLDVDEAAEALHESWTKQAVWNSRIQLLHFLPMGKVYGSAVEGTSYRTPRDLTRFYSPTGFKNQFPTTRVIVDGTECPIKSRRYQRPSRQPSVLTKTGTRWKFWSVSRLEWVLSKFNGTSTPKGS